MNLRARPRFIMKETRFGETVKALRVLVVDADVIGERVAPGSHLRSHHRQVECAFLPLQYVAQFVLARSILDDICRSNDGAVCGTM